MAIAISYQPCCGKTICVGCKRRTFGDDMSGANICPFCRANNDERNSFIEDLEKRAALGDARAIYNLGVEYDKGRCIRKDELKANGLFHQAAEHGSPTAHGVLATMYRDGQNGLERSLPRSLHHELTAAMGGHCVCRHNIGTFDIRNGYIDRALKHFIIAASDGYEPSLQAIKKCYIKGIVSKEDFAKTLRAYQARLDAVKSKERGDGLLHLKRLLEVHSGQPASRVTSILQKRE